jgi:asparagine synthase (glutamine-hydrolysing)
MCGIFGWVLEQSQGLDEHTLIRLTDQLTHRGPDGSGYWLSHTTDKKFQIAFGHRRLAIIDIEGGSQPMWSADGQVVVVFNGEIYNYVELRHELRGLGHNFTTTSDTEVLIESYRAWGEAAFSRLRGMFAFALFDVARQRLLLVRDPFGKKPLFIAKKGGGLIFGSELASFLEVPGFDRKLDWNAFGDLFVDRYVSAPATLFQSIKKLSPGCIGTWDGRDFEIKRYFIPPYATVVPNITDFDEATALFSDAFRESVQIRMRSDAPFGAYLSGGIDSSAVVATMVQCSSAPVRTFSVGFTESEFSELSYAREVADAFRTDHHELVVTADDYIGAWLAALKHRGAPVSEPADIPILLLSRMARNSVKMVLTGEGSDELLAGYPKHMAERWVKTYQSIVPAIVHDNLLQPIIGMLPYAMRRVKIVSRALGERDLHSRMRLWFGGVALDESAAITGREVDPGSASKFPFSCDIGSPLRRMLFFDQTSWLPDNLLERGDRMMMAASIEGRMPFMDTELSRLVARFPDRFLTRHPRGKAVLRQAMEGVIPKEIVERKKVGFRIPINEWFRGPYADLVRDLLEGANSEIRRICDRAAIDRYITEHLSGRHNHERVLWMLMNVELFIRTFKPDLGSAGSAGRASVEPAAMSA